MSRSVLSAAQREIRASLRLFSIHLAPDGADPLAFGVCLPLGDLETVAERFFITLTRLARFSEIASSNRKLVFPSAREGGTFQKGLVRPPPSPSERAGFYC